jgi:hypothetical protein
MFKPRSCAIVAVFIGALAGFPATSSVFLDGWAEPHFRYVTAVGCGDVFFHAVNEDRTEFLKVEVDFSKIVRPRGRSREVFNLANREHGVAVAVAVYSEPEVNRPNCTDLFITEESKPLANPSVWEAVGGRLIIERGPRGARSEEPWLFHCRLRLERAAFRGPIGQTIEMDRSFAWEGYVGWQAG